MNEPAAPHLDRCREMDFSQLARFIEDALWKPTGTGLDSDILRTRGEFLTLWEMLREKYEVEKPSELDLEPEPPQQGEPKNKLAAKRAKRERTRIRLVEMSSVPSKRKKDEAQMRRTMERLDREIEELEDSGLYDYPPGPDIHERTRRTRTLSEARYRTLYTVRGAIERRFELGAGVRKGRFQWHALPPSESSREYVLGLYEGLPRGSSQGEVDNERLTRVFGYLDPNQYHVGMDGFDGYVIFTFAYTPSVLLECARVGNAIYVIHKDWERWSRMTKQELMADESGEVCRIEHRGKDWFEKVKQELGVADLDG